MRSASLSDKARETLGYYNPRGETLMRRTLMALAASAMLAGPMVATPADVSAARDQTGVIVLNVEGNKDLVDVLVAASTIATVCGVEALTGVNVLNVLTAIDQDGGKFTFCRTDGGKVTAKND